MTKRALHGIPLAGLLLLFLCSAAAAQGEPVGGDPAYDPAAQPLSPGGPIAPAPVEPLAEEGEGLPLVYARRPLTLTAGTVRIDAAFSLAQISFTIVDPATGALISTSDTAIALNLGGAYGIMDDLEVGATVLPLLLSPDVDYGDPTLYGLYRFVRGDVDVGASLSVSLPVQGDFGLTVGAPVRLHLGEDMRLDTGLFVPIVFADPDAIVSVDVPFRFSMNVTQELFLGARTGILLPDFDFDFLTFPLGLHAGYTLAGGSGGPLADIVLEFAFPAFLMPASPGDAVVTNLWTLTLGGNIYLDT